MAICPLFLLSHSISRDSMGTLRMLLLDMMTDETAKSESLALCSGLCGWWALEGYRVTGIRIQKCLVVTFVPSGDTETPLGTVLLCTIKLKTNLALPDPTFPTDSWLRLASPTAVPFLQVSSNPQWNPFRCSRPRWRNWFFDQPKRAHVTPLLIALHWLPMTAWIWFMSLMLAWSVTQSYRRTALSDTTQ